MARTSAAAVTLPRKISREQRRQQLIDATMRVLAREGYAQTTLSDVAAEAGVSHGLVNFHFDSKEKLLAATLQFMAEEYLGNWTRALENAGPSPAERLDAMMCADYDAAICTPERLACWCAFWSEVQSRPLYRREYASMDRRYIATLEGLCAELIRDGGYGLDVMRTARCLRLVNDGLWFDMLSMEKPYSRAEAIATLRACAAAHFPRHFSGTGVTA